MVRRKGFSEKVPLPFSATAFRAPAGYLKTPSGTAENNRTDYGLTVVQIMT
ncbi:MAG: hypothetical protein J1F27_06995 [Prevotellaceae bacterium]|nr:hypothetical protein [Prevotellaceae bacterium]